MQKHPQFTDTHTGAGVRSGTPSPITAESTAARDLTAAEIGEAVRRHRIRREMRQGDLAEKAGLSTSFISQFERGLTDGSISSLTKICVALGITVGILFQPESERVRVLRAEEMRRIDLAGAQKFVYSRPSMDGVDVYSVAMPAGGSTGDALYEHNGQHEMVICQHGYVAVEVAQVQHVLRKGDSIDFASELPHRIVNIGNDSAEIVWIVADVAAARSSNS